MEGDGADTNSHSSDDLIEPITNFIQHKAKSTPSFESAGFAGDYTPKRKRARKLNRLDGEIEGNSDLLDKLPMEELGEETKNHARFTSSLYITSSREEGAELRSSTFAQALTCVAAGRVRIERTRCGLVVAFTRTIDAENALKLPLKRIFGKPVEVVRFPNAEITYRRNVLVRNVPWCISELEVMQALKLQGIHAQRVRRIGSYLEVELTNALDRYRLIQEGLNFFNRASFDVLVDSTDSHYLEPDIVQCYKCQGFWHTSTHCREQARCVRCGGSHELQHCPRSRNNPMCCHCGGPHHAASKECPVRIKHIHSSYLAFTLSRSKPKGEFTH